MKKQVFRPNTMISPLQASEIMRVKMKQIYKIIVCFALSLTLLVPMLVNQGLYKVYASDSPKLNTTAIIIDQGNTFSLSMINLVGSVITWTSENPEVAAVDEDGVVTAIDKGSTKIVANVERLGSKNKNQFVCEVGVKTASFLPETPTNYSYLAGRDIKAGQYVVFSDKTSSLGAFWEINNVTGNKIIDNEFTSGASVITVKQSQSLVIHRGYAIPMSNVSEGMLRLYNISEIAFFQKIG